MHSKKLSIIISIVIIALDVFLFILYFQKQNKYTFEFAKNLLNAIIAVFVGDTSNLP